MTAPKQYKGSMRMTFVTKVVAVDGEASCPGCPATCRSCPRPALRTQQRGLCTCRHAAQAHLHLHSQPRTPPSPAPITRSLQTVTLERPLPYDIKQGVNVVDFHPRSMDVSESGVEGLTFNFRWELYAGHHKVSSTALPEHAVRQWEACQLPRPPHLPRLQQRCVRGRPIRLQLFPWLRTPGTYTSLPHLVQGVLAHGPLESLTERVPTC